MSQPKHVAAVLVVLLVCGFAVQGNADENVVLIHPHKCSVNVPELHVSIVTNDTIVWKFKSQAVPSKDSATITFKDKSPCKGNPPLMFLHPGSTTCIVDTSIDPRAVTPYKYSVSVSNNNNPTCNTDPSVVVENGRDHESKEKHKDGMKNH